MSCGCGCGSCGLGRNLDLSILGRTQRGLRGLGEIKGGSQGRVGFAYNRGLFQEFPDPEILKSTIQGCLYASGAFNSISVNVEQRGFLTEGLADSYLTINFSTAISFGNPDDIGGQIQQTLQQCYPDFASMISRRDQVLIDAVPQGTNISTIPVANRPPAQDQQNQSASDSLLSLIGLGTPTKAAAGTTGLIVAIIAAVVIAKAFK